MRIGVYAGSFCPVTLGHVDAIAKSAHLVDKLYVVMGVNAQKKYVIPADARLDMLKCALKDLSNVEVVAYDGMMTDYCRQVGATVMIKSIRNAMDTQSVIDITDVNDNFWDGETVFVVGSKQYRHISSSLVRELAGLKKDFSQYVPKCCLDEITKYLVK
ncbi:MAG: pantetheine-phosphate adenylyltransferase [Clostridia bacterium]|nr:pantetheine-phosphate adenylyltransferase [Clostridia bacterium]